MVERPVTTLRDLVFEALDNAESNEFAKFVREEPARDVAADLMDCDVDIFEAVTQSDAGLDAVVPLIEEWRKARLEKV